MTMAERIYQTGCKCPEQCPYHPQTDEADPEVEAEQHALNLLNFDWDGQG